jgi:hypothetical protein
MKKISSILLLFSITTFSFSQIVTPDTSKREYKNVIGLDATGILREVVNLSSTPYFYSPYIISYRRIIKRNAIRVNIGGYISNSDVAINGNTMKNSTSSFDFAVGFEHYAYLTKRWNYYYGIDLLTKIYYTEGITNNAINRMTKNSFGISPLVGLQFRINPRMSISTEASYDIIYAMIKTSSTFNFSPYSSNSSRTAFEARFNSPLSISFRIQF